jgi:hypothetical protein
VTGALRRNQQLRTKRAKQSRAKGKQLKQLKKKRDGRRYAFVPIDGGQMGDPVLEDWLGRSRVHHPAGAIPPTKIARRFADLGISAAFFPKLGCVHLVMCTATGF